MQNIIRKSETAKLTTSKFDGVRRCFVVVKTLITIKLPHIDISPNTKTKHLKEVENVSLNINNFCIVNGKLLPQY